MGKGKNLNSIGVYEGSKAPSNQIARPNILKPVQPPVKRDSSMNGKDQIGYQSGGNYQSNLSGGQSDNESARLSNVNTYKYNKLNMPNSENLTQNIRKVSPAVGF